MKSVNSENRPLYTLQIIFSFLMVSLCASCGQKQINGRAYLNDQTGTVVPIPNLKVMLVKKSEFDAHMESRHKDAEALSNGLREEVSARLDAYNESAAKCRSITETNQAALDNESYVADDPEYNALTKEAEEMPARMASLQKSLNALIAQYGRKPVIATKGASPQQQSAYEQEYALQMQLSALKTRAPRLADEIRLRDRSLQNVIRSKIQAAQGAVDEAGRQLAISEGKLADLRTDEFYLSSFNPAATETAISDYEGKFSLRKPNSKEIVFAKLATSKNETLFWAIEYNPKKTFQLTEENIYHVPK